MRFFLFCLLSSCFSILFAQKTPVHFYKGKWEDAVKLAEKEQKLIFVDFRADWCRFCRYMEDKVFQNDTLGAFFNEYFISYQFDIDKDSSLYNAWGIEAVPYIAFMKPEGKRVWQYPGALDKESLLDMAKTHTGYTPEYGLYKKNPKSPTLLLNYLKVLAPAYPDSAYKIAANYLKYTPRNEWLSFTNFAIISTAINDCEKPEFQHVLDNSPAFYAKNENALYYLMEHIEKLKKKAINQNKKETVLWEKYITYYAKAMRAKGQPQDYYEKEAKIEYALWLKEEKTYLVLVEGWLNQYHQGKNPKIWAEKATQTVIYFRSIDALDLADKFAQAALKIENKVAYQYAYAFVLFRKASYNKAIKAIDLAKTMNPTKEELAKLDDLRAQIAKKGY
ncbi:MAG: thioredoxin family protein [Bacteroidia bacterium]